MGTTFKRLGLSELLPRYVFAEGLYARRRVLEVGAVASTRGESARFLMTRGARAVLAVDADLAAVEAANQAFGTQHLRYRANVFDDLEGGSFDVLMVADLGPYVRAPELLRELVRLLARGGLLIGGLRNPAGLALSMVMEAEDGDAPPPTWGQLLDALSSHFPSVEVATQSPVLGYQLAFEKGDGLQVDGSLAESTEAAYFVAIAGTESVRTVDPTWVQLPPEPLAYTGGKLEDAARSAREWKERTERMKDLLDRSKKDLGTRDGDLKETREQLLGAREAVARLTVQLEELQKKPKHLDQQDELAARIRRLEAELGVARERAQDAEGRVQAAKAELEAQNRAQKDAAVEAIAAQEVARLERSRREEVVTQLEDARTRLAAAYEDHGRLQDELANGRVELERTRLQADRVVETLSVRERELATAKEREIKLAEGRSEALAAIEGLEGQLSQLRGRSADVLGQLERKEGERLAAIRNAELETQARMRFEADLSRVQSQLVQSQALVAQLESERPAFDTELQEAKAASARLARDIEVLAGSERTWRGTASDLESRLANTQANVEALTEQLAIAESAKEAELARYRRLEKDLSTAIGAERSAREQAEFALADARREVDRLTGEVRALAEQRDGLNEKIAELETRRSSIAGEAGALEAKVKQLEQTNQALERQVAEVGGALVQAQKLVSEQDLKLTRLREDRDLVKEELQSVTARLTAEESRAQGLDEDLTELKGLLASAEAESNGQKAQLDALTKKLADAEQRFQSTDAELHAQIRSIEEAAQKEKGRLEDLLRNGQAELDRTRAEAKQKAADADAALAQAKADHAQKAEALAAEQSDARTALQQRLDGLAAELEQARAEAKARAEGISADRDAVARSLEEARADVQRLTAELAQAKADAQTGLDVAQSERDARAQAHAAELAEARSTATAELERARADGLAKAEALTAALAKAQADAEAKAGEISAELSRARADAEAKAEALQAELQKARDEHQAKLEALAAEHDEKAAALRTELEDAHAKHGRDLDEVSRDLSTAEQSIAALTAELDRARKDSSQRGDAVAAELAKSQREHAERAARLRAEVEVAKAALAQSEGDAQKLKARVAQAEADAVRAAEVQAELTASTAKLTDLEQKLRAAEGEREHLLAEVAEGVDARLAEQGLREATQLERDAANARVSALEAELAAAKQAAAAEAQAKQDEAARLGAEAASKAEASAAELTQTKGQKDELEKQLQIARDEIAKLQSQGANLEKAREEAAAQRAALEAAIEKERAAAIADLEARKTEHQQQLAERETMAQRAAEEAAGAQRRAVDEAAAAHRQELEARDAAHRQELENRSAELQKAVAEASEAGRREADGLKEQLTAIKEDRDKYRNTVERAHSEARGHQTGKLALQKELAALRDELAALRAASAVAGGESAAMSEARAQAEQELERLRGRLATLEADLPKIQARRDELEAELPRVRASKDELDAELQKTLAARREAEDALAKAREEKRLADDDLTRAKDRTQALESEVSAARGTAQGSTTDLETAIAARRQAEELLLALRTKYAELQDNFTHVRNVASDVPRLREELNELKGEAQLLESERERLSSEVERLEKAQPPPTYAPSNGDLAAELALSQEAVVDRDARLEAMLRRVQAQDSEIVALKKRLELAPAITPAVGIPNPTLVAEAKPPPPAVGIGKIALVKKAVPNPAAKKADAPRVEPAKPPRPSAPPPPPPPSPKPSAPPVVPGVELEVFELDVDEDEGAKKDEELLDEMLILEDDDEPLNPGKK